MSDNSQAIPVAAGLAIGIAFIVLFAFSFNTVDRNFGNLGDYLHVSVDGLKGNYQVGEAMNFTVKAKGYAECSSHPTARIINTDSNDTVYNIFQLTVCFSDEARPIDETWTLKDMGAVVDIILEESGNYKAAVHYGGETIEKEFIVR